MGTMLVNLGKKHEEIMESLVKQGFYQNKSEILRAGVLQIGKEFLPYSISQITDKKILKKLQKIDEEIGKGKLIPISEIRKKYSL